MFLFNDQIIDNISTPSEKDVANSLTSGEMPQDQLFLSNQTPTTTAKTTLEKENTVNVDEMYLPNQERRSRGSDKVLVSCIIGLSCIAVVIACLHIGWCVVDVYFM